MGNQVLRFMHLISWIHENSDDLHLVNVNFWRYANLFQHWSQNSFCRYPIVPHSNKYAALITNLVDSMKIKRGNIRGFHHFLHKYSRFIPGIHSITSEKIIGGKDIKTGIINLENSTLLDQVYSRCYTLIGGWRIEAWGAFERNHNYVRPFFQPHEEYQKNAEAYLHYIRSQDDFLVGVLIRQDDYRCWRGGRYFFETHEYINFLHQIKDIFQNKNVKFLIASDEHQKTNVFERLNAYFGTGYATGRGHFMENLIELSMCDVIASPPSTFSALAAFLGDIPIIPLIRKDQVIEPRQFIENHFFDARRHEHFGISVK